MQRKESDGKDKGVAREEKVRMQGRAGRRRIREGKGGERKEKGKRGIDGGRDTVLGGVHGRWEQGRNMGDA